MNASHRVSGVRLFPAALALLLVLPLLAWAGSRTAYAAPLPDLKVTALSTAAQTVAAGSSVGAEVTVKNAGRKKAGGSLTRFYLSRDDSWSKTDLLLGKKKVAGLPAGDVSRSSVQLTVPSTAAARRYFVVACADAKDAVKESREGNNCRATDTKVDVTDGAGMFPLEPDPLSVDSTLQTDNAVTRTAYNWDVDGGTTIVATADDGTTYTLEVPFRALWNSQEITMTPVASVSGIPLSNGLVAGVQIEPHGLLLQEPATLTIESPDAGALANQSGFLFHEDGDDFHLYPMDAPEPGDDKDVIRMTLTHFSTPGVGLGTAGDRGDAQARPPVRNQSQMQQAVSDLFAQERQSQLNGNPPNEGVWDQVAAIHNAYYDEVLRGQLQAAETNTDLGPAAVAEGTGWSRARELLGDPKNPRIAEIRQRVERIFKNMMNEFWKRCEKHELAAIVWLQGVARQAGLLGYAWAPDAWDKAERCANFEVRFESRISGWYDNPGSTQSHQGTHLWHVESTAHVPVTGFGDGPLTFAAFDYDHRIDYPAFPSQCVEPNHHTITTGVSTEAGSLAAMVQPLVNPREEVGPGKDPPPVVRIQVYPGFTKAFAADEPEETYRTDTYACGGPSSYELTDTRWLSAFVALHARQQVISFEIASGMQELIATKAWNRTIPDDKGEEREDTTLEIWHKPLS